MGLFDFFKKKEKKTITNSIGTFELMRGKYHGLIDSKIGAHSGQIELIFPVENDVISDYQVEYFKKIRSNWHSISQQLSEKVSNVDVEKCEIDIMIIPDKGHKGYDFDAKIVVVTDEKLFELILKDLTIEEMEVM